MSSRAVPTLRWIGSYRAAYLRSDLVAGVTTAAVVIPQAMAYATIAGLPLEAGLYCALVPMAVYAFLGTSRPLSVSTTSTISLLTAQAISSTPDALVLGDTADDLIHEEGIQAVVLDLSAGDDVDTTTSAAVKLMLERADEASVNVVFARMHQTVRKDLESGEVDLTGRLYPRVEDAVEAFRRGELRRSPAQTPTTETDVQ